MRGRLFWQLLTTFVILIIFGVGGTSLLIVLSFRQLAARNRLQALERIEPTMATALADYYVARGNSWAGVDERLSAWLTAEDRLPANLIGYVLFDRNGQLVTRGGAAGVNWATVRPAQGTPVRVAGRQVGSFALLLAGADRPRLVQRERRPVVSEQSLDRQVRQVVLLVSSSIALAALGLAVVLSRRISAPLSAMTRSAQQVAAGDLQVQVPGSSIHEVDALARAFNQMAADLAQAAQLRRNFTADIAHELRTPLTVIKGKLEGVLDGVYPGTAEHLAPVLEETNLLERLIGDLRMLSLAEAGQLPLQRATLPIEEVLRDVEQSFAAQAARQQVALCSAVEPTLPPVEVDPQRMQQVLGNLVANSLRYTPASGRIMLSAARHGDQIRIAVADTGSGIAPPDLPHIFDRFWRGDKARSRQGSSTGLGLAIARQLVEAHGGQISAESQLGTGTTITIQLPLRTAPPIAL